MTKMICAVFRSSKKDGCYLYINKARGLDCVPADLMSIFGKPVETFTFLLTPEKKLARAKAEAVLADLNEKGFYLQLPPPQDMEMQKIHLLNDKIGV